MTFGLLELLIIGSILFLFFICLGILESIEITEREHNPTIVNEKIMMVGCMEYKEAFGIPEQDIKYETMISAIKCPICKAYAYLKEIDVFVCDCGLVWCIE